MNISSRNCQYSHNALNREPEDDFHVLEYSLCWYCTNPGNDLIDVIDNVISLYNTKGSDTLVILDSTKTILVV